MTFHSKTIELGPASDTAGPGHTASRRRRFTAAELLRMESAGILGPEERVELIDGEIIVMPAKSARHDDACAELGDLLRRLAPDGVRVVEEKALRLSQTYEPEPDLLVFRRPLTTSMVRGDSALLVVEVAVSSLSMDLDVKAPRYAAHGVREYWVIDAKRLRTFVHRGPGRGGYAERREVETGDTVSALLVAELSLRLADIGLEPLTDAEADAAEAEERR